MIAAYGALNNLRVKKSYVFWLAEEGPEGLPFLQVDAKPGVTDDFVSKVEEFQKKLDVNRQYLGFVHILSSGRLVFQLDDDIRKIPELFRELVEQYSPFSDILDSALIQDTKTKMSLKLDSKVDMLSTDDFVDLRETYQLIKPKMGLKKVYYWFASQTLHNGPLLVFAHSRTVLREYKEFFGSEGAESRGLLQFSKGQYWFVPKDVYKGFLQDVRGFIALNDRECPDLKKLRSVNVRARRQ